MNSMKYISCRTWSYNSVSRLQTTGAAAHSRSLSGIEIPARIERSPTDILQALSEAIPPDPNAHHYKYLDDKHFRPNSTINKVNWAMAREWGKRAAHFVHHEHSDLFPKPLDNTQIPVCENLYFPQSKEEVSEQLLLTSISKGEVELALRIYGLLEEDVSTKAKLSLFQLLCYCNAKYPSRDEKYPEFRFFVLHAHNKVFKEWGNASSIQKLFDFLSMQEPSIAAAAYNALICGMSKFGNVSEALTYYEKCINQKIPLDTNTYYELFKRAEYLHQIPKERPKVFNNLLNRMFKSRLRLNAAIMSSCMRGIIVLYPGSKCREVTESVLRVFKQLGVQRSLASYYYEICAIVESGEIGDTEAFDKMFKEIAGRKFEIQELADLQFFPATMEIFSNELENADYALALHKIFTSNNNVKFLSNSQWTRDYYEALLSIVLREKPLRESGMLYKSLVPHTYLPTVRLTMALLEQIKQGDLDTLAEYLPTLLESVAQAGPWQATDICLITELMLDSCRSEQHSSLREICARKGWEIYRKIIPKDELIYAPAEPALGQSILNSSLVQIYCNKSEEALEMLNALPKLDLPHHKFLTKQKIHELLDACLQEGFYQHAVVFLECLISCQHPGVEAYANKLDKQLPLDTPQKKLLLRLVGSDVLSA